MSLIIDTHTHVIGEGHWPSRYFDQIAYNWGNSPRPRKDPADVRPRIEGGLTDQLGDQVVADMNGANIDISLVLPIDWGPTFDEPEISERVDTTGVQEAIAAMVERHPKRLIAFAATDPRRKNGLELLVDAHKRLGARGLKLYPPNGFYPYDPAAFPIYEYCQSNGLPILFHTGPGGFPLTAPRYADVMYLRDVQSAFPQLLIWIGHAGGRGRWDDALSVLGTGPNSYLEVSTCVWDDTTEEAMDDFTLRLANARDRFGAHRIIFGSDHVSGKRVRGREFLPTIMEFWKVLPARSKRLGNPITDADLEAIMGANAAEQLGIS